MESLVPVPVARASTRSVSAETAVFIAFAGDAIAILLGLLVGYWMRFQSGWFRVRPDDVSFAAKQTLSNYLGLIVIGAMFLIGTYVYLRLYRARRLLHLRESTLIIVQGATFWLFAYLGVSLFLRFSPPISRLYVFLSYFMAVVSLLGWRSILSRLLRLDVMAASLRQSLLMVGWTREAADIFDAVNRDERQPYVVAGYVPSPNSGNMLAPVGATKLGEYSDLIGLIQGRAADMLVLCDLEIPREEVISIANHCEREGIQFKLVPNYFQILISGLQLETVSGVPILGVSRLPLDRLTNRTIKRIIDLVGAVVGLILSAPIMAVFGAIVYLESPGPVLYRQTRTGRNGRPFTIYKIRSMRLDAEVAGAQWAQKDDPRRLRIGSFMRAWNVDEVPQFWNVLTGDMSLVGPRPERPELIANFKYEIPHYNARHAAKPGITGWAQVHGLRGNTDLAERVRYDLWYLENWSPWLDFQIMLMTFFKRDNAY